MIVIIILLILLMIGVFIYAGTFLFGVIGIILQAILSICTLIIGVAILPIVTIGVVFFVINKVSVKKNVISK